MRLVPWSTDKEWQELHQKLYSFDKQERSLGVKRVKAWGSRGKLPHAIESTAIFVEIGLQDDPIRFSTCSHSEISLLLSMALVRFVNGIVDAAQKGTVASSVSGIAEQLGLPLWFVELRHSATHDKLPTLSSLRRARVQALEWLETHYWKVKANSANDKLDKIARLLDDYRISRTDYLKGKLWVK